MQPNEKKQHDMKVDVLEKEVMTAAIPEEMMNGYIWASSLTGTEFARKQHYTVTRRDEYLGKLCSGMQFC